MTPEDMAQFGQAADLTRAAAEVLHDQHHLHSASAPRLVLQASHAGRDIVISVQYVMTVDGKRLDTPLILGQDGVIGSHALPTHAYRSPVDLVKALIDAFPDEI